MLYATIALFIGAGISAAAAFLLARLNEATEEESTQREKIRSHLSKAPSAVNVNFNVAQAISLLQQICIRLANPSKNSAKMFSITLPSTEYTDITKAGLEFSGNITVEVNRSACRQSSSPMYINASTKELICTIPEKRLSVTFGAENITGKLIESLKHEKARSPSVDENPNLSRVKPT